MTIKATAEGGRLSARALYTKPILGWVVSAAAKKKETKTDMGDKSDSAILWSIQEMTLEPGFGSAACGLYGQTLLAFHYCLRFFPVTWTGIYRGGKV